MNDRATSSSDNFQGKFLINLLLIPISFVILLDLSD